MGTQAPRELLSDLLAAAVAASIAPISYQNDSRALCARCRAYAKRDINVIGGLW